MKKLHIIGTTYSFAEYTIDSVNTGDEAYLGLEKTDMVVIGAEGKIFKCAASAVLIVEDA